MGIWKQSWERGGGQLDPVSSEYCETSRGWGVGVQGLSGSLWVPSGAGSLPSSGTAHSAWHTVCVLTDLLTLALGVVSEVQ